MPIHWDRITEPSLIVREDIARRNIGRMQDKARRVGVRLRPHFKTHQSATIGEWFREAGVDSITVSSLQMAEYFAAAGWQDILIAFPVNVRAAARIQALAQRVRLSILVDSPEALAALSGKVTTPLSILIEIDCGDGRSGIHWQETGRIASLAGEIGEAWTGLMTHAGHSYAARGPEEIHLVHRESLERMATVRRALEDKGMVVRELSVGDTPTCSTQDRFPGATEIRPGNFVFYDLMQEQIGSCTEADISLALACPVVARYPDRGVLILHGGAVHLGKDFLHTGDGKRSFGRLAYPEGDGWSGSLPDCEMVSLSQEHGVARVSSGVMERVRIGDLLFVLPVHSCLTMDLMGSCHPAESQAGGRVIGSMRSRIQLSE